MDKAEARLWRLGRKAANFSTFGDQLVVMVNNRCADPAAIKALVVSLEVRSVVRNFSNIYNYLYYNKAPTAYQTTPNNRE